MSLAIYPGSFDPLTLGHLDVIERAAKLFDKVVVAVSGDSCTRSYTFADDDRVEFVRRCTRNLPNLEVILFRGLLSSHARALGANVIIRGLRAISDFEREYQMASVNRELAPEVETVVMMTRAPYAFLSSGIVKEIAAFGGDVSGMVPARILEDVRSKLHRDDS